jgi:hypothetical protein
MFLDGEGSKARDAVHVLFAREKVRSEDRVSVTKVGEKWDRVPFAIPVAMFLV